MLGPEFFARDAQALAKALLGMVLRHKVEGRWLAARIIETEAYYTAEKASHSSLGRTPSREPMFMTPGTIYMYHSQGGPSMNVSAQGEGNAVLFKSGFAWADERSPEGNLEVMQRLNPTRNGQQRKRERLCSGQALLCQSLGLEVKQWSGRTFDKGLFFVEDVGAGPMRLVQSRRLGIPTGRDEHLMYRFIDAEYARWCTSNPLTKRAYVEGRDYRFTTP